MYDVNNIILRSDARCQSNFSVPILSTCRSPRIFFQKSAFVIRSINLFQIIIFLNYFFCSNMTRVTQNVIFVHKFNESQLNYSLCLLLKLHGKTSCTHGLVKRSHVLIWDSQRREVALQIDTPITTMSRFTKVTQYAPPTIT